MEYPYGEPLDSRGSQGDLSIFKGRDSVDLLARMIYSEAQGECTSGKMAVAHIAKNRKMRNSSEFGGSTYEGVLLLQGGFDGMTTSYARRPDLSSQAWQDCLAIAMYVDQTPNPVGNCLWYATNDWYQTHMRQDGWKEFFRFNNQNVRRIVEKCVVGNQTFLLVEGYELPILTPGGK